jgi:hypothetical protein
MVDPQSQVFGELIASASFYSKDTPWSGFLNLGSKFNEQFWSLTGNRRRPLQVLAARVAFRSGGGVDPTPGLLG